MHESWIYQLHLHHAGYRVYVSMQVCKAMLSDHTTLLLCMYHLAVLYRSIYTGNLQNREIGVCHIFETYIILAWGSPPIERDTLTSLTHSQPEYIHLTCAWFKFVCHIFWSCPIRIGRACFCPLLQNINFLLYTPPDYAFCSYHQPPLVQSNWFHVLKTAFSTQLGNFSLPLSLCVHDNMMLWLWH